MLTACMDSRSLFHSVTVSHCPCLMHLSRSLQRFSSCIHLLLLTHRATIKILMEKSVYTKGNCSIGKLPAVEFPNHLPKGCSRFHFHQVTWERPGGPAPAAVMACGASGVLLLISVKNGVCTTLGFSSADEYLFLCACYIYCKWSVHVLGQFLNYFFLLICIF